MTLQPNWYLGFLSLFGLWFWPDILDALSGDGPVLDAAHLLWFLWLLNFIPENENNDGEG